MKNLIKILSLTVVLFIITNKVNAFDVNINSYSSGCGVVYELFDATGTNTYVGYTCGVGTTTLTLPFEPVWGRFNNGNDFEFLKVGDPPLYPTFASSTYTWPFSYNVSWNKTPTILYILIF